MSGKPTIEAILLLKILMKKYIEACKNLHLVFFYLEKSCDRASREVKRWNLKNKRVPLTYIKFIKDIYDGAITIVRTCKCIKNEFPITIGLHQGSTLNPYLFAQVADELMKSI